MELKYNSGLKALERSHPETQDQDLVTSVNRNDLADVKCAVNINIVVFICEVNSGMRGKMT